MTQELSPSTRPVHVGVARDYFVDPIWHERDLDAIFRPRWLYAAHGSQLPKPGSFITFGLGDDEIVVCRTADMGLAAYYNFCRHRGHPLVTTDHGEIRRSFVCPYHGWSFSREDGACKGATRMNADFDKTPWSLRKAWVEEFHGLIYVSFADNEPTPIAEATRNLTESGGGMAGFDLDGLKWGATKHVEIEANWKIVVENDEECYHCSLNHPELVQSYDPWTGFTVIDDLDDPPAPIWSENDWPIVDLGTNEYGSDVVCQVPLPRVESAVASNPSAAQFFWRPSGHLALNKDYAWIWSVKPLGPHRTQLTQHWLVAKDAEEGRDYDLDTLTSLFDVTMAQDEELCKQIQRGFSMRRFTPGPLNPHHQGPAITFYDWYLRCLEEWAP